MGSRSRPAALCAAALAALAAGAAAALWVRARRRGASAASAASAASGSAGGRRQRRAAAPVLVLGLDGAGKTSVLRGLATGTAAAAAGTAATEGAHGVCAADGRLRLLEVGGSEALRPYWGLYMAEVPLLVYVVDAADHARLPLARQLLHELLREEPALPLVVLANKQDLEGAYGVTDVHEALALDALGAGRKVFLIGTHAAPQGCALSSGLQDARELIAQLLLDTQ